MSNSLKRDTRLVSKGNSPCLTAVMLSSCSPPPIIVAAQSGGTKVNPRHAKSQPPTEIFLALSQGIAFQLGGATPPR